jgi:hypothetical protein
MLFTRCAIEVYTTAYKIITQVPGLLCRHRCVGNEYALGTLLYIYSRGYHER